MHHPVLADEQAGVNGVILLAHHPSLRLPVHPTRTSPVCPPSPTAPCPRACRNAATAPGTSVCVESRSRGRVASLPSGSSAACVQGREGRGGTSENREQAEGKEGGWV
jgi:hypothetical protein